MKKVMDLLNTIKAEIERRIENNNKILEESQLAQELDIATGVDKALTELLSFLDTLKQSPQGLDEAAEQAYKDISKGFGPLHPKAEMIAMFKACASWMAGQGVTMQITDDTQWEEVDRFVHRNCDGASCIQIRKKED